VAKEQKRKKAEDRKRVRARRKAEAVARAEGIEKPLATRLQVAFPGGLESAASSWAVLGSLAAEGGGAQPPDELEVLYAAAGGERLARRSLALHFCDDVLPVEGSLSGFSPPPDDIFSMPFQVGPQDLYPLPSIAITGFAEDPECREIRGAVTGDDGRFAFPLPINRFDQTFTLNFRLGYVPPGASHRFVFVDGLQEYTDWMRRFTPGQAPEVVLNRERVEFEAFHLMTYHHLRQAERDAAELVEKHKLFYDVSGAASGVRLGRGDYYHRYLPLKRLVALGSDQFEGRDERGRWRKIVPTILYHEWGHDVFLALTGGYGDTEVHEGVSDAFSAYVARAGTLGFVDPETPNADPAARDLGRDLAAFPAEPRRAVAGARGRGPRHPANAPVRLGEG
jgi:hypothetical protein